MSGRRPKSEATNWADSSKELAGGKSGRVGSGWGKGLETGFGSSCKPKSLIKESQSSNCGAIST